MLLFCRRRSVGNEYYVPRSQEKWDGTGYPQGQKGEEIPVAGRLMAVADVYDALISRRTYREPLSHDRAVEIMKAGRGTHFDPDVLDAFLEIQEEFRSIARQFEEVDRKLESG
jgi:putative two-component system response regulator